MSESQTIQHRKAGIFNAFNQVASRYDWLSGLNPGYHTHLRWSAERLQIDRAGEGAAILDLCCGTGLSTAPLVDLYPRARIVGLDNSAGMLDVARGKPALRAVTFVEGDGMSPASAGAGGPFDGLLMAYGIRNMRDPDGCLTNLRALLKPGGIVCIHEYSVADAWWTRMIWNLVMLLIVIPLAFVTTGSTDIFRYLRRSALEFDGVRAFEARLRRLGFVDVETLPMDGWQRGITHTFRARRPA